MNSRMLTPLSALALFFVTCYKEDCKVDQTAVVLRVSDTSGSAITPDSIKWTFNDNNQEVYPVQDPDTTFYIGDESGSYSITIWENGKDTTILTKVMETGSGECTHPDKEQITVQMK